MNINIDLHQKIYDQLITEAEEKGLTVEECIRVILGEYISFSRPRLMALPPMPPMVDKFSRLADLMISKMTASGDFKCSNCTMPLNSEALEKGECQSCGYKL